MGNCRPTFFPPCTGTHDSWFMELWALSPCGWVTTLSLTREGSSPPSSPAQKPHMSSMDPWLPTYGEEHIETNKQKTQIWKNTNTSKYNIIPMTCLPSTSWSPSGNDVQWGWCSESSPRASCPSVSGSTWIIMGPDCSTDIYWTPTTSSLADQKPIEHLSVMDAVPCTRYFKVY